METQTIKGRAEAIYDELHNRRVPYLERAKICSKFTIPSLIPPDGTNGSTDLYKPWQSLTARGVNNLASKLLLTLFPPNKRFFRLILTPKAEDQAVDDERQKVEEALGLAEDRIVKEMESRSLRPQVYEALRHLIVAGNVAVHMSKTGIRVFTLGQFTCRRNPEGELVELVVKELVYTDDLPAEKREEVLGRTPASNGMKEKTHSLFTHVWLEDGVWKVRQECRGVEIMSGTYGKRNEFIVLRWTRIDGEDYGRSLCDDHLGDIIQCEGLNKALQQWAAMAAKILFLTNPNGQTDPNELTRAESGDFVDGIADDITVLGVEKLADFQVVRASLEDVSSRLSYGFLLNSAVRRDAERVTAEEIQFMARELEDTLGGVYSVLSQEFQLPLVELTMKFMERAGTLGKMPDGFVRPTIVTGIDALGRSHELARLDAWIGGTISQLGPEAVLPYVNMLEVLRQRAVGLDIDSRGLLKSEEQVQQEQQQQQMMALAEKAAPNVVKGVSDAAIASQSTNV